MPVVAKLRAIVSTFLNIELKVVKHCVGYLQLLVYVFGVCQFTVMALISEFLCRNVMSLPAYLMKAQSRT